MPRAQKQPTESWPGLGEEKVLSPSPHAPGGGDGAHSPTRRPPWPHQTLEPLEPLEAAWLHTPEATPVSPLVWTRAYAYAHAPCHPPCVPPIACSAAHRTAPDCAGRPIGKESPALATPPLPALLNPLASHERFRVGQLAKSVATRAFGLRKDVNHLSSACQRPSAWIAFRPGQVRARGPTRRCGAWLRVRAPSHHPRSKLGGPYGRK